MFSQSLILVLQLYAIAAAISLFVAVIIKTLVKVTGHVERRAQRPTPVPAALPKAGGALAAPPAASTGIPDVEIAVVTAAVAAVMGPHRVLHIAQGGRSWSSQGRTAQHSHQPKR